MITTCGVSWIKVRETYAGSATEDTNKYPTCCHPYVCTNVQRNELFRFLRVMYRVTPSKFGRQSMVATSFPGISPEHLSFDFMLLGQLCTDQ